MEIGVNIIQGLIAGIQSAFGVLMTFITGVVSAILAPFAPILELLGIDISGGIGGAVGGVGGIGTTDGTLTTGTQNYYNYYYGPVYFNDTGQTNGGVDCQYPNPVLSATGTGVPLATPG